MTPEDVLSYNNETFNNLKEKLGLTDQKPALTLHWGDCSYVEASNIRSILRHVVDKHLTGHPNPYIVFGGEEKGYEVYFTPDVIRNKDLHTRVLREIRDQRMLLSITKVFDWNDLQDILVDNLMAESLGEDFEIWDPDILSIIAKDDDLESKLGLVRTFVSKSFMMNNLEHLLDKDSDWCFIEAIESSFLEPIGLDKALKRWKSSRR